MLKGFGCVTILNGHIHQTVQKVEGNITFHTARSTAFPQPEPGMAAERRADGGAGGKTAECVGVDERYLHRGGSSSGVD